ncbi:GGDEF domain-containing protein [Marinobacter sp. OP 3.4]|uniref:GGDEF domain-containing protein n=1 Tax=Marinobacter sp. OP 3.4 TaxID=3076501 RepID=UPI002E1BE61D
MFASASLPERFREAYARYEQRMIREVMVKAAWVLLVVSVFAHSSILIRGGSLIEADTLWSYGLRVPPLAVCLITLVMHYRRFPGHLWPLVMLRLISLTAMSSVLGLLVFAYDQGGTAFRVLSELAILSVFCAGLVSLRGLRGCVIPLFLPVLCYIAVMIQRGHEPLALVASQLGLLSAIGIAAFVSHLQLRIRVREFIARQELNEISTVDPLTGLMNRRAMVARLESERARHNRFTQAFAVIMLDLDLFKRVNDTLGHQAGDQVLREVAARLRANTRQQDDVARWGGEEFLILLPDTDEKGATAATNNIRAALRNAPITTLDTSLNQTASFGIAVYDNRESTERLVARAGQALHMAKECGRNRAVVA